MIRAGTATEQAPSPPEARTYPVPPGVSCFNPSARMFRAALISRVVYGAAFGTDPGPHVEAQFIQPVTAMRAGLARRKEAIHLNNAAGRLGCHGASGAKPTPMARSRRGRGTSVYRSRERCWAQLLANCPCYSLVLPSALGFL